jgi:hypothetical protein
MARKALKSPEERIAEAQALIARLEAQAAQEEIAADPKLEPIRVLVEALKSERLVALRGFSNHAQSFANRRLAHQLWIVEIDAQEAHDRAHAKAIEHALNGITEIDFEGMDAQDIADFVTDVRTGIIDSLFNERMAVRDAKDNREVFNLERKAPKRKPKEDAAEA